MEGRAYRCFQGEPRFAFGHGLSYTISQFDNLHIGRSTVKSWGQR
jgi:hypothetical protein